MTITRRSALMSTLFGAGYVGLRALATGIPASVLLRGPKALAADPSCAANRAQYIIMQTSSSGDPINTNAPGTYATSGPLSTLSHPQDPSMAPTALKINGIATTAALPWATPAVQGGMMPQSVLDRMSLWHIRTNTPIHPKEGDVLRLNGATVPSEMLPSLLAKALQPCLNTIQPQPICIGAANPGESLTFNGQPLPVIPPTALKDTLTSPAGGLLGVSKLQALRDDTLGKLRDIYDLGATDAQRSYIDSLIMSQSQLRGIHQDLLAKIGALADNSVASQITAAIVLIQMNVSAVITIHIPFGGDNHFDANLGNETAQTPTGLKSIADLMSQLETNSNANGSLIDQVSFLSLNVFGRTLGPSNTAGRQHNDLHQVSLAIGKPFVGGIVGGVGPDGNDFGCLSIDSTTGAANGDIGPTDTLAAFGKTMMSAVGIDDGYIESVIPTGKIVTGAIQ